MAKPRNKPSLPKPAQFVQLINAFRAEPAWRALSCPARLVYVEIKSLYNGQNNGRLMASVRWLVLETGISKSAVERALRDLQEHGFIVAMRGGYLGSEGKAQGTLWRLTELGHAGDQPTKDYRNWRPKNKSPSPQRGQRVIAERTLSAQGVPAERTGCPSREDTFGPKSGGACPLREDDLQSAMGGATAEPAPDPADGTSAALARAFVRGLASGTFSGPRTFAETINGKLARVGARVSVGRSRSAGSPARGAA